MKREQQVPPAPIPAVLPPFADDEVRDQDKLHLIFAYLCPLSLIPLLTSDRPSVKWHAKNGLVLGISAIVIVSLLRALFGWMFFIGTLLALVANVFFLVVDLLAMVKALKGQRLRIPFLTEISEKL